MADHLKEKNPDYTIIESNFQKKGFNLKTGTYKSYNEVKVVYTFIKKDGSVSAERTEIMDAYGEYCPFCGKKEVEETEVEDGM